MGCKSPTPCVVITEQAMTASQLLLEIRQFLVPKWIAWGQSHGKEVTERGEGMCRFTAAFLANALGRGWRFSGGTPDIYHPEQGWIDRPHGGGFWTGSGWEAHHWVTNGALIVDLTASQFGAPQVLITPKTDPRFRETLQSIDIQEALRDVRDRARQWATEWDASRGNGPPRGGFGAKRPAKTPSPSL